MLNVIMLNVIMLSVIIMSVIMLSDLMLNVIMLNVIMLNVNMLNVVAPLCEYLRWVSIRNTSYDLLTFNLTPGGPTEAKLNRCVPLTVKQKIILK